VQAFFSAFWQKLDLPKKSKNSIFTQKLDFRKAKTRFLHEFGPIFGLFSSKQPP